eukprot:CAMPEP_0194323806 /NCGR_PEP_ID=MMETSP0171-20130528/25971_1 /TAXON_ID=218684 /ORGANISM="Corethron pennatum, Strain L29A3" /LENGTH=582 /DNA_ID=CAMNT_0039082533 /DNA_START=30 /DNA_END=1775 /DNA_ORIENTATION=+
MKRARPLLVPLEEPSLGAMKTKTETSTEAKVIEEDAILVEELLSAGVPLERTVELFRNRIEETDINRIARKIFALENVPENAPNASLTKLGKKILERSVTAGRDEKFMDGYISHLAEEAPEDFLDPILMTIMTNPVVLSSGLVLDRDTVLDAKTGKLKFSTCPITREKLKKEVYPIIFLKKRLAEFKEKKIRPMLAAAAKLVENGNLEEFIRVQKIAKDFIDSLGEATYSRHEKEVAELNLTAWNGADDVGAQLWSPAMLADSFIRIYRATPELHDDDLSEEARKKKREFSERISVLEQRALEALAKNEPDAADTWCEACALVKGSCGSVPGLAVHRLRLRIGKKRGVEDLRRLRICAYCEILHDPDAVRKFCEEEGMDAKDCEALARVPIGIKIKPGWYIDSVTFAYLDGRKILYGGAGGDHADICKLEEGEMLVSVEGFQYNQPKYLGTYVRFGTSLNRDIIVQAAAHYVGGGGAHEGYPDNNFPILGGQGIYPHATRDGHYYRFVNNQGIFGLKTDMNNTSHGKIVGVIDAEEHLSMVGAYLPDGSPLQNRDEVIASMLDIDDSDNSSERSSMDSDSGD